jgi:hypothetical protein
LDSAFFGLIFDRGMTYMPLFESWVPYGGVATWGGGYAPPLLGNVVDMLYFPLIDSTWPDWVPVFGGDRLVFFRPNFNLADAATLKATGKASVNYTEVTTGLAPALAGVERAFRAGRMARRSGQ